ncbi:MAG: hypothetical protein WCD18_21005 [Thermosynechococcaceae cyanobacterium]
MVTIVVGLNISLALFCLGIAYKVNRWRRSLRRATDGLRVATQATDRVLSPAPKYIFMGQTGTEQLRHYIANSSVSQPHLTTLWSILELLLRVRSQHQWLTAQGRFSRRDPQT